MKIRQWKTERFTLMFPAEPRELSLTMVQPGSDASVAFSWWLRVGPFCLFRLNDKRSTIEKNLRLNVK